MRLRSSLLFRMSDPKRLIEDGIELDLAAPPIIIVFAVLTPHEEPTIIDFSPSADYRYTGPFGDSDAALLLVGEPVPFVYWEFRESDSHPTCDSGVGDVGAHLILQF